MKLAQRNFFDVTEIRLVWDSHLKCTRFSHCIIWGLKHSSKFRCHSFLALNSSRIQPYFYLGLFPACVPKSFHRIVSSESLFPAAGLAIPHCSYIYIYHAQSCQGNGGWIDMCRIGRYILGSPTVFCCLN